MTVAYKNVNWIFESVDDEIPVCGFIAYMTAPRFLFGIHGHACGPVSPICDFSAVSLSVLQTSAGDLPS